MWCTCAVPSTPDPSRLRSGLRRHGWAPRPAHLSRVLTRRGLRLVDGNAVDLYSCGRAAFPAMLDAIAGAQTSVHLETYILRDDRTGRRFLEALTERAGAGVDVRLLYDAFGSHQLDPRALAPLVRAGGDALAFNPLRRRYPRWAPRRRDHRKLLIVDGRSAFTGGLNLGDEYDAADVDEGDAAGWRDTHVRVRGPAVHDLSAVFLESWFRAGGAELDWRGLLDNDLGRPGPVRCGVLPDGPVYRRRALRDLLVESLDGAQETARLTSPYFAPDRRVLDALERAAARNVRVELILAGRTDHPVFRRAARSVVERLLRAGARVHEYVAAVLHAKSAVFDDRLAIVGTSNLDRQSLRHNYEVNVVVFGPDVPNRVDRLFETDRSRSVELTLDSLARRGSWTRAIDWLAARLIRALG